MTNIYVLEQESSKFYVGKAADVQKRFDEHLAGTCVAWTKKYKPIRIASVTENASAWDEDRVFKSMVAAHGIDNVRGAAYTSIILTEEQKRRIQISIWAATDKCIRCGRNSHFVTKCYAKSDINGNPCRTSETPIASAFGQFIGGMIIGIADAIKGYAPDTSKSEDDRCGRCLRAGHDKDTCYARTMANGEYIGRPM